MIFRVDDLPKQDINALEAELRILGSTLAGGRSRSNAGIRQKAEQQSLAETYGLDFVTDTYLPEKLDGISL